MTRTISTRLAVFFFLFGGSLAANAQNVGINTTGAAGHNSAMLDVSATDKGILVPRLSLSDVSTASPVSSPAAGLLVYNTNASVTGGFGAGFYYWSGSAWVKMATGNSLSATLSNGKIWIGNASNVAAEQTLGGDGTLSNTGVLDLSNLAVETSEINDLAVTTGKLADNAVDGTKINIASNATGDLMYYNGTDWVRLAAGGAGQILKANGAAAPSWDNGTNLFTFENGLTETSPSTVRLGGSLMQNTVIDQGGFTMAYTSTATNGFSVDGTTFSVDAANNRVGIGTTTPSNTLDVAGILEMNDYAIQLRGGGDANHQVVFSSAVDGPSIEGCSGIQFKRNCTTAILGTWNGTALDVQTGSVYARNGLRTERQIYFYKRSRNNGQGGVDNLGNYDFCYLGGAAFRNSDSNTDEDDDYQCNVYTLDINASAEYNEGENESFTGNFTYLTRPAWRLYSECYQDCSNSTCTAMCINFDY